MTTGDVGRVLSSSNTEVVWRVADKRQSPLLYGEYHVVDLADGLPGLIRWLSTGTDARGLVCHSLLLGAIHPARGVTPSKVPAKSHGSVRPAQKSDIRNSFWLNPEVNLPIGRITGTDHTVREWLSLRLQRLDRHMGIFAQSGSGKSYSLGRLIEELLVALRSARRRHKIVHRGDNGYWRCARIIVMDPNGDFVRFQEKIESKRALQDLYTEFSTSPAFFPHNDWEHWLEERHRDWSNFASPQWHLFQEPDDSVTWYHIDLQDDFKKRQALRALRNVESHVFGRGTTPARPQATFVVIDEAHNLASREPDTTCAAKCSQILQRLAGEGRKYGAFLILVTQSPAKIHPTVLSQCANLILMRMTTREDIDTAIRLRSDVPAQSIERVATFGVGEALFIGDFVGAPVTAKITGRFSKEGEVGVKIA